MADAHIPTTSEPGARSAHLDAGKADGLEALVGLLADAREDAGPKYIRLGKALATLIERGVWRPGDQIPKEVELADQTGLSLGTVQRALGSLAKTGLLMRKHGHGTFVAGTEADGDDLWYFRFRSAEDGRLLPVTAKATERRAIKFKGPWNDHLSTASCIRIRRVLQVADAFSLMSDYYIEHERFADLLKLPLPQFDRVVLRAILSERYNAPTISAMQRISCDILPTMACRGLGLPKESHGLIVDLLGYTYRSAPISYQRIYVPAGVNPMEIAR